MNARINLEIDVSSLVDEENNWIGEDVSCFLADLQDLANGRVEDITLQKDTRGVRVSTATQELEGGEIEGLNDACLDVIKAVLEVSEEGHDEIFPDYADNEESSIVHSTKIMTVEYVEYDRSGPQYGGSSEVYLRYASPGPDVERVKASIRVDVSFDPIADAVSLIDEVIQQMGSNSDSCDIGDLDKLKKASAILNGAEKSAS